MNGRRMVMRTGVLAVAAAVAALASAGAPPTALSAAGTSLHGTVTATGKPLGGAQVTLFAGSGEGFSELGHATTDTSGSFGITYARPETGVLYVRAAPAARAGSGCSRSSAWVPAAACHRRRWPR